MDAAIASLLCVGVVNLHSTGIGGGGFLVYYNATSKKATVIDHRERAPAKATSNMYDGDEQASLNGENLIKEIIIVLIIVVVVVVVGSGGGGGAR